MIARLRCIGGNLRSSSCGCRTTVLLNRTRLRHDRELWIMLSEVGTTIERRSQVVDGRGG